MFNRNREQQTIDLSDLKIQIQSMVGASQELDDTEIISENIVNLVKKNYVNLESQRLMQKGYDIAKEKYRKLSILRWLAIALSIPLTIIAIVFLVVSHQPRVIHDLRPTPLTPTNVLIPKGPLAIVSAIVQQSVNAEQNTGPDDSANISAAYQLSQQAVDMTKGMKLTNKELAYANALSIYNNAAHDVACDNNYSATPNCDSKFSSTSDLPSTDEYRNTARSIAKSLELVALNMKQ